MARKRFKAPKVSTVIGKETRIKGDLEFQGGLHLDGRIEGSVSGIEGATSSITVSEQGRIEGDVRVDALVLNGTVVGDVHASERVELAPQARVTGTVYYQLLEMAMGAEVNGQLVHGDMLEAAVPAYDSGHDEEAEEAVQTPA